VGNIVYDTGYQRRYNPGVSGNLVGFFVIDDNHNFNKFNYISASASGSFALTAYPMVSSLELYTFSQSWILTNSAGGNSAMPDVTDYVRLDLATETPTSQGNLSATPYGSTRQAISTGSGTFLSAPSTGHMYSLNYSTRAVSDQGAFPTFGASIQIPCGMSVDNTHGYLVGMNPYNVRFNFSGASIIASLAATQYTYNFGESHSLVGSDSGFMMAGYSDTTGRYGNTQHGLCQKMSLATEVTSILPDLVLPQSSGQMMQGF
jgi:hypothetical protein